MGLAVGMVVGHVVAKVDAGNNDDVMPRQALTPLALLQHIHQLDHSTTFAVVYQRVAHQGALRNNPM